MTQYSLDSISALRRLGENRFQSINLPFWMANSSSKMAYGGCAMVLSINAAAQTVPAGHDKHIYSVLGTFLGPTRTEVPIELHVQEVRETRTFSTRFVVASQQGRSCLSVTVDFIQAPSPSAKALLPDFSLDAPQLTHYSKTQPERERISGLIQQGSLPKGFDKVHFKTFAPMDGVAPDTRTVPESVLAQTLSGYITDVKTTQDDLKLVDRRSYWWQRTPSNLSLGAHGEVLYAPTMSTATAMLYCFVLDGASSFVAPVHSRVRLDTISAASSLDFAYRIHGAPIEPGKWYAKEIAVQVGACERTYIEARLWEEDTGRLAATLTEATILRAKQPARL